MTTKVDKLFDSNDPVGDFSFDHQVAAVFDDMVRRSVPFYDEVQRMVVEIAASFLKPGDYFYDIGCATGTTIEMVARATTDLENIHFVGIDPSSSMLSQASEKLAHLENKVKLVKEEVQTLAELENAGVIVVLYTLQFIRPIERLNVLKKIRESLRPGGCVILAEKILADEKFARRLYIDMFHRYKQSTGYSQTEIAKKREALENVLIPFQSKENIELLHQAGFTAVEQAFRWYNFALYIAVAED